MSNTAAAARAGWHAQEPSTAADDVGRAMRASAVDAIRHSLGDVEIWARDGVVAHLKRPAASGRAVADDCSAVARLVCAASTVTEIDATRVSAARMAFAKHAAAARPEMRTLANAIKAGVSGRELDAQCGGFDSVRATRGVHLAGMGDPRRV